MKNKLDVKIMLILLFCLVFISFTVFVLISAEDFNFADDAKSVFTGQGRDITKDGECSFSVEKRIVRGNSLTGLIESGEEVKALFGYYNCNKIEREDIILYFYAGDENPLIKVVKAIPGDKFCFKQTEAGWNIFVNEKILKNSEDKSYLLDERGYKMLSLYEENYNGIIPEETYLIMGNSISRTLDSSRYGLVDKSDVLGKVEIISEN